MIINGTAHKLFGSDEDSELILIDEEKAFDRAAAPNMQIPHAVEAKPNVWATSLVGVCQARSATFGVS